MSLKIRLARGGSKKRPFYHIVVADVRSPRDGRYIERLGFYNPMVPKDHQDRVRIDNDRAKHWLHVGAKPTDRVHRFLAQAGLLEAKAITPQTKKDKPKAKALERIREREEAANASSEDNIADTAEDIVTENIATEDTVSQEETLSTQ